MPRPTNTGERKEQIVKAMIDVMGSYGYAGATIPLVAKKAKLLPGLVHYHFENKQAILLDVLQHLSDLVLARFAALQTAVPNKQIDAYIDAHLAYGPGSNKSAVACWVTLGAAAVHDEDVRTALQKVTEKHINLLEEICEATLKAQGRKSENKHEIVLGIYAAIEGTFHLLVSAPQMITPGFAAPTVKLMADGLIASQPLKTANKRRT